MRLVADLHVHSRYSRATSREADLDGYHRWARVKGIDIIGTGDFTHPAWIAELSARLVEKDGLFVLRDPPRGSPLDGASPADRDVRFALTTEISSIYKKHGFVRKVHSLIVVRTLDDARRLGARFGAIGNIASDGRPILGLDPKDLLSIVLESTGEGFLIPAHIWTPWFSLFGSRSGFDRIEECFEELTPHIFALETGLSSDPAMNWRWSALDRYRLVSNSDAHSPGNLGREANLLDADLSWQGLAGALRTGKGFLGTVEFYPEEGKYHYDGHRKCGVCMDPEETLRAGGKCPACGAPVTVGVLSRVLALADRPAPRQPRAGEGFHSLIPLPEVLAELAGTGSGSRAVGGLYSRLIGSFGSEFSLLMDAPVEDIARSQGTLLAEAIRRMRAGTIRPSPGYDGEFGVIRVFEKDELARLRGQDDLFPAARRAGNPRRQISADEGAALRASRLATTHRAAPSEDTAALDEDQEKILASTARRILVSAGPGSGKTRMLAHWVARAPGPVLALTFTNRAAAELSQRISSFAPARVPEVTTATFHSFCWSVLREHSPRLLTVLSPVDRLTIMEILHPREGSLRLGIMADRMEQAWEGMGEPDDGTRELIRRYDEALSAIGAADVSSLVQKVLALMRSDDALLSTVRGRFRALAVDELQDINRPQFELLGLIAAGMGSVFCIGDPDQSIYGFRGSDRSLFFRFVGEAGTDAYALRRNYRSAVTIVSAADAVISPVREKSVPPLAAVRPYPGSVRIVTCADPSDEGRIVASQIRDLVGGVDSVSVDAARSRSPGEYSFSEIAVLSRTRAVRDSLLPGLQDAGFPLSIGVHAPLSEEEPFRSLIAALRLVVNPADIISQRVLSARGDIVGRILERIPEIAQAVASAGICVAIDILAGPIIPFDRSLPGISLGEELIRAAAERKGSDLASFLAQVSLCTRESEGPRAPQKISLLTFHAAKGLEFPVVFIAGAEEGITPMEDRLGVDIDEERRLFYVAMTRARDILCISHCQSRVVRGVPTDRQASRFILDIPAAARQDQPARRRRETQLTLF
jgi:uncharacterized protein (TIGR00375 family)